MSDKGSLRSERRQKHKKYDYFKRIRKPVPKTGGLMRSKRDYNRSRDKEEEKEVIKNGIEDYEEDIKK